MRHILCVSRCLGRDPKAHPKHVWMGYRGSTRAAKNAQPNGVWMGDGLGWAWMGQSGSGDDAGNSLECSSVLPCTRSERGADRCVTRCQIIGPFSEVPWPQPFCQLFAILCQSTGPFGHTSLATGRCAGLCNGSPASCFESTVCNSMSGLGHAVEDPLLTIVCARRDRNGTSACGAPPCRQPAAVVWPSLSLSRRLGTSGGHSGGAPAVAPQTGERAAGRVHDQRTV